VGRFTSTIVALIALASLPGCGGSPSSLRPEDAPYPVRWGIDPTTRPLSPDTTTLAALVSETRCTGGRSPEGRLLQPEITYAATEISILILARPLPPSSYTCPGSLPVPLTIALDEPLGDRQLIDLGAP
jgi:hypothetical protein